MNSHGDADSLDVGLSFRGVGDLVISVIGSEQVHQHGRRTDGFGLP